MTMKKLADYLKIVELDSDLEFAVSEDLFNNIALIYPKDYQKALQYYNKRDRFKSRKWIRLLETELILYYYKLNDKEKALK